jgi:NAD+ synthase
MGGAVSSILPERDSSDDSAARANLLASHLGIRVETVDIAPALAAIGCYASRDAAVRRALPEYGDGWRFKIVIEGGIEGRINRRTSRIAGGCGRSSPRPNALQLPRRTSSSASARARILPRRSATAWSALRNRPVRFLRQERAADVKPIAHLYKTQVYGMARFLGLPERVCAAIPTTDTYSLEQGQDEFYFALPYRSMDLALWALNHDVPASELAECLGIAETQAEAVYEDIRSKRRTTRYLHRAPILVGDVRELDAHD